MDAEEVIQDNGKLKLEVLEGNVEFKNVYFAYNHNDYVLKDMKGLVTFLKEHTGKTVDY